MKQQTTDKLLTLGMALYSDKRSMERRVRGIFARKCSAGATIALAAALTLSLLAGAFTTACQPAQSGQGAQTPQAGAAKEAGEAAPQSGATLYETLGVPQHWSWSTKSSDQQLNLSADVDITLPSVNQVPVATATMRKFTEEDLKKTVRALFGENAQFTLPESMTKEAIEAQIALYDDAEVRNKSSETPNEQELALYEKSRTSYETLLEQSPFGAEAGELPLAFYNQIDVAGNLAPGFFGKTQQEGYDFLLTLKNETESPFGYYGETSYLYASMGAGGYCGYYGTTKSAPDGVSLTKEQAIEQATAIAAQLTDELVFCYAAPVHGNETSGREEGWACVFMRAVNGFPTAYVSQDVNGDLATDILLAQSYERITIVMDDLGVADFQWVNPMQLTAVTQQNAQLLSFEDILAKVPDAFRARFDYDVTRAAEPLTATITGVSLGLMRVGASGGDSFTFEPVWSFFYQLGEEPGDDYYIGTENNMYDGYPAVSSAITLSALDGRVIDRNIGY